MRTLLELRDEYFAWESASHGGRPMGASSRNKVRRFVAWLGEVPRARFAHQLTPDVIREWLRHESSRSSFRSGLPLKAVSFQTSVFKVAPFCQWLCKAGYVARSVPEAFPVLRRVPIQVKPALLHRDVRRLLDLIPCDTPAGHRNRALAEFLYTTGVRIAEALAMNLEDLDLDSGTARVHGKGNKDRVVPIGARACHYLRSYIRSIRPMFLRSSIERALWLGGRGERLVYTSFLREWNSLVVGMGMPIRVTPHTFRRSCATELHRSGAPAWAIRELLGHRRLCTLRYYLDIRAEDLRQTHTRCHPRDLPAEEL